jgi:hypothetical protein|tara:strand:- start:8917 stop:9996 length:1080 start_codon:yes stop_codon:yes gene_type:complete
MFKENRLINKNPFFADNITMRNNGVMETETGIDIISVDANGSPTVNADVNAVNATFTGITTIGDDSGDICNVNAELNIEQAHGGNTDITKTDDSSEGPELTLFHHTASPAADDETGIISFNSMDDAANETTYAEVTGYIDDATNGSERGYLDINVADGTGSTSAAAEFWHDGSNGTIDSGSYYTDKNIGTPGADVSADEYGDGRNHVTVLDLSAAVVGTPNPGNNLAIGVLIYTFPAGAHVQEVMSWDMGLTTGGVQTDTPDVGIGSVIGSGVNATLAAVGATSEDYVTGQTWSSTLDGTSEQAGPIGASAGVLTDISLNGEAAVKEVYLNAADGWNAGVTGDLNATGKIVIKWTSMNV